MDTLELQGIGFQDTFSKEKMDFCADTKASSPFSPFSCACFKKCCKKYKKGIDAVSVQSVKKTLLFQIV
ncbi:hypothetical protein OKW96_14180 [Sphingobacterium sp. KU25419]|nr:hypothetical protein OKW96_14180 [Sphingobacterium sp. KU25419]